MLSGKKTRGVPAFLRREKAKTFPRRNLRTVQEAQIRFLRCTRPPYAAMRHKGVPERPASGKQEKTY